MHNDFSTEYSELADDELLQLASERGSLAAEAVVALDAELRRRKLSESDQVKHQKFVKRQEWRESKSRRRKVFGERQFSRFELIPALIAIGVITWAYFSLPKRYQLKPDWQEAAAEVMIVSVIVIVGWRSLWRDILFWVALLLSTTIQLAVVHKWIQQAGEPSSGAGKLATVLGFAFFFAVYGTIKMLRRNFYGESSENR